MTTFDFPHQMSLLSWLENNRDAGLTIDDLIEGLQDGTLTSESEPNKYVSGLPQEI